MNQSNGAGWLVVACFGMGRIEANVGEPRKGYVGEHC